MNFIHFILIYCPNIFQFIYITVWSLHALISPPTLGLLFPWPHKDDWTKPGRNYSLIILLIMRFKRCRKYMIYSLMMVHPFDVHLSKSLPPEQQTFWGWVIALGLVFFMTKPDLFFFNCKIYYQSFVCNLTCCEDPCSYSDIMLKPYFDSAPSPLPSTD